MFSIEKIKINFGIGKSSKLNWLFNPLINLNHKVYCRFFAFIFPSAEIKYELLYQNKTNKSLSTIPMEVSK